MFLPILIITCKLQPSRYNGKSSTTLHCHNPLKRHTVDIRQYGTEKVVTPVGHDFTKSNTYIRLLSVSYRGNHLQHGRPTFLWQWAATVTVVWFAGNKSENNTKWYS